MFVTYKVDFEPSEHNVVNQADLVLVQQSGQEETILPTPMEFDTNEDQTMLMDTGTEEIIGKNKIIIKRCYMVYLPC